MSLLATGENVATTTADSQAAGFVGDVFGDAAEPVADVAENVDTIDSGADLAASVFDDQDGQTDGQEATPAASSPDVPVWLLILVAIGGGYLVARKVIG